MKEYIRLGITDGDFLAGFSSCIDGDWMRSTGIDAFLGREQGELSLPAWTLRD